MLAAILLGYMLPGHAILAAGEGSAKLTARIEADKKEAVIGNGLLQLTLGWKNGLQLKHLRNLATGVDWIPQPPTYPYGTDKMVFSFMWTRKDAWPDLAPPSREFLLRYSPSAVIESMSSGETIDANQAPSITLTGEAPCKLVPERSSATVEGGVARLNLTVALEKQPFEITLHSEIREGVPAIRRWVSVSNTGKAPLQLHRLTSALLSVRPGASDLELYWLEAFMHPSQGDFGATRWRQMTRHMELLGPSMQRTLRYDAAAPRKHDGSNGSMAWLALRDPSLNEGLFAGWEWSGMFDAEVGDFREGAGSFGVRMGFSDEGNYSRLLAAGESFTTPKIFYGFYQGDADDAGRVTRNVAERLYGLPWPDKRPPMFISYDTWTNWQDMKGAKDHLKPERLDREIALCKKMGVELFILDYDWFALLGEFKSDPKKFPEGIGVVGRKVKAAGMKFGIWLGFGQASPDAPVVKEHPEYLVTRNGKAITGGWGMRSLCFAYKPCREWMLNEVCNAIKDYGVEWLKHDFDLIRVSDAYQHSPNASDTRIETVEGYYWIMDEIHKRFPNVYLDNWTPSMGGADFGNFQRHHSMLPIDDYNPVALRSSQYGITHLFPSTRTHGYIRSFSHDDEKTEYPYRSAAFGNGMILFNDILQWDQATIDVVKREIQIAKHDRELFLDGQVYNLFPGKQPDHFGWEARYVWSPGKRSGMAQVFRNHDPRDHVSVAFRCIKPDKDYTVEFVDAGKKFKMGGEALLKPGLTVTLPKPFSVETIRISEQ